MREDEENGRDEVAEKPEQPPKNRRGGNRFFTADEMENIPKALGVFVLIFVALWLATVVALFIAGFAVENTSLFIWAGGVFVVGTLLVSVLILAEKLVARAKITQSEKKYIPHKGLKIFACVVLGAGFTALTVFGIIKNNEWMLIGGAAGLIILFFIAYGAWFGRF